MKNVNTHSSPCHARGSGHPERMNPRFRGGDRWFSEVLVKNKSFVFFIFLALVFPSTLAGEDIYLTHRKKMVEEQIRARGVFDSRVLSAMMKVKRHLFVDDSQQLFAYDDHPLPIGHGQTISQPYIVAYMTEAAKLKVSDRVLEIGTGSGYQAAILAEIVSEVYSIEILKPLADRARETLTNLGYKNIQIKHGDGYLGWPEFAPFDVIIVTAAPDEVPQTLVEQLAVGGRMVVPVGSFFQNLYLIEKTEKGIERKNLLPVRFVPMVKSEGS